MDDLAIKIHKARDEKNYNYLKEIFKSEEYKKSFISADKLLLTACEEGDIKMMKCILSSSYKRKELKDYNNIASVIKLACKNNNWDAIFYLLTSPLIDRFNCSVTDFNNYNLTHVAFAQCANLGNINTLEKLLDTFYESESTNDSLKNGNLLIDAIMEGHLNVVKFLFSSPKTKEKLNIHKNDDQPFKCAYNNNHIDILKYFIFDLNIEKTLEIDKFLKKKSDLEIDKMFETRSLKNSLSHDLSNRGTTNRKTKI